MNPKNSGLLVVHGTGTGKTLTAITASQCYLDKYPKHRVVVISPATLINNFTTQMMNLYGSIIDNRYEFYSFSTFCNSWSISTMEGIISALNGTKIKQRIYTKNDILNW